MAYFRPLLPHVSFGDIYIGTTKVDFCRDFNLLTLLYAKNMDLSFLLLRPFLWKETFILHKQLFIRKFTMREILEQSFFWLLFEKMIFHYTSKLFIRKFPQGGKIYLSERISLLLWNKSIFPLLASRQIASSSSSTVSNYPLTPLLPKKMSSFNCLNWWGNGILIITEKTSWEKGRRQRRNSGDNPIGEFRI